MKQPNRANHSYGPKNAKRLEKQSSTHSWSQKELNTQITNTHCACEPMQANLDLELMSFKRSQWILPKMGSLRQERRNTWLSTGPKASQRQCRIMIREGWSSYILSLEYFRPIIDGIQVHLDTDHRNLQFVENIKHSSEKLARWAMRLSEFNYKIAYKPGKDMLVADCLSRNRAMQPFQRRRQCV